MSDTTLRQAYEMRGVNEIREAFEDWYNSTHREPIHPADRRIDGDYRLGISGLWRAWQAAIDSITPQKEN